MKKFHFFS